MCLLYIQNHQTGVSYLFIFYLFTLIYNMVNIYHYSIIILFIIQNKILITLKPTYYSIEDLNSVKLLFIFNNFNSGSSLTVYSKF